MAHGGDIIDFSFNNPIVGSGVFFAKAGESSTYSLGGYMIADDSAMDMGGNLIVTKNRKPAFFEVTISNDMNTKKDLEKLVELATSNALTTWTFRCINGVSYGGQGVPVGDLSADIDKSTIKVKVACSTLKQI